MRLAIGAPSSPVMSNILMMKIDTQIATKMLEDDIIYTRYADDMTFSARRTGYLVKTISDVASIIRSNQYPKLSLNTEKTTYITKKYGRYVTGLTITNEGTISIGRDKKRLIHSTVHRAKNGLLSKDESQILAGMLAYVNAVEPHFIEVLKNKYGAETLEKARKVYLLGHRPPPHKPPLAPY